MRLVVRLPCKRTALSCIMRRERRKKKASWIPLAKISGSVGCFTRFIGTEGNMICFMVLEVCVCVCDSVDRIGLHIEDKNGDAST
jgi:hypothetical protein